jgi:subtilisin family serine protease
VEGGILSPRTFPGFSPGLHQVQAAQQRFAHRLSRAAPGSAVLRSYTRTLNGIAVRMTAAEAGAVRAWPEVLAVMPDAPFRLQTFSTPAQIGAPALWAQLGGPQQAGDGVKIAVIDSGVYATRDAGGHYAGNPCFDDAGYPPLPGYPLGDKRFTNNKVVVARAYFRPGDPPAARDDTPLPGPAGTGHGTHVAGTAACNAGTGAKTWAGTVTLSGVAPRARVMNYRVFYPTARSDDDFSDGNGYTIELVAAMEDAVRDGADVILGSWASTYRNTLAWPDPMVQAAEAAVDAGVVVVMAHGNGGPEEGTTPSPALSAKVISVGAVSRSDALTPPAAGGSKAGIVASAGDVVAGFSARGPGPDGIVKPDMVAPGVDILSAGFGSGACPRSLQGFGTLTGSSMAAPHVAGAAALLIQRHPGWTPAQVKSALMSTATEHVYLDSDRTVPAGPLARGAGRVDVAAAAMPGLTLDPPAVSAPLVRPDERRIVRVSTRAVEGGAGTWDVTSGLNPGSGGARLSVAPRRIELGEGEAASFDVAIEAPPGGLAADADGWVAITQRKGGRRLHLAVWASGAREPTVDVLLIDADGSGSGPGRADYAGRYREILGRLGLSQRTIDLADGEVPGVGELRAFRMALLFTGDREPGDGGLPSDAQNRLTRWLDEGGRLWVAGQNTADVLDIGQSVSAALGRSRLYNGFLGLAFAVGSLWEDTAVNRHLDGSGLFAGLSVDLAPGKGVATQDSVEAATAGGDTDTYSAYDSTVALFGNVSPGAPTGPSPGFARSSDPTPGEARRQFLYRTVWTGFGLEGINPSQGSATAGDVARRATTWLMAPVR